MYKTLTVCQDYDVLVKTFSNMTTSLGQALEGEVIQAVNDYRAWASNQTDSKNECTHALPSKKFKTATQCWCNERYFKYEYEEFCVTVFV